MTRHHICAALVAGLVSQATLKVLAEETDQRKGRYRLDFSVTSLDAG